MWTHSLSQIWYWWIWQIVVHKGGCSNCGISKLQLCPSEVDPSNEILIPWKRFENVFIGHSDDGGDWHAIRLVFKMTFPFEFLAFLKPKLTKFVIHKFEAKWQDAQFKSCLDNFKKWPNCECHWFCWELLFQGVEWNSFLALVQLASHYTCAFDISYSPKHGLRLMHHLGSWQNINFMWATTKHMIICLCNTTSNSIGSFLHCKVFCCLLNTFYFLWLCFTIQMCKNFVFCCTLFILDQEGWFAFGMCHAMQPFWFWSW